MRRAERSSGLGPLRRAVSEHRRVPIDYVALDGERTVRPLGLYFWGMSGSMAAWCELRQDFRTSLSAGGVEGWTPALAIENPALSRPA